MYSRFLVSVIAGVIFLLGFTSCIVSANEKKLVNTKLAFEHYTITAPFKVSLPIIALDLVVNTSSSVDELAVIGEDEQGQTWLAVYYLKEDLQEQVNAFSLLEKIKLPNEYFAFDVSENSGGLYFLAKNKVVSLKYNGDVKANDDSTSSLYFQDIKSVNSIFLLSESNFITKKDFIQDVNKDGQDDIILPDFEQTNLWLSSKTHSEQFYQHLAIKAQVELERGGILFKPTRLFLADFNLDERADIAWVSKGVINYFSQNEDNQFSIEKQEIALVDSIYAVHWWDMRESSGEQLDQSNITHRAVEEVKDINGDGLVDVIVKFTKSSGVLDRVNDYEFYLGYINKDKKLAFPKIPNTVIKAEGTLTGLQIIDVNKDERFEVLLSSFELSVSNIIGALLSGGIDQNILLFALNNDNSYEEDALISKEVELNFSLTSGKSGQPVGLLSDVNGDGFQDLILSSDDDELSIFMGNNTSKLFNKKASKHKVLLPENGELFTKHDINHDGKEDFIMHYNRLDDESMANKITILMVK